MKINKFLFICLNTLGIFSLLPLPAHAVYLKSIVYALNSNQSFISLPVFNDTKRNNLYTIKAYKILRPGKGDEVRIGDGQMDLIWSPLKFTVDPNEKEYFKLYYRGPSDNLERYYRVIFREIPVSLIPFQNKFKKTDVMPVVGISTILIVRPRKINLDFTIDEKSGVIKNTGNTFFRVILQKGCSGDDESSTQFYMLPGESWKGVEATSLNRKYIVANDRYFKLGKGCFYQKDIP